MRNTQPRDIEVYETLNGQVPFTEWFASIQDTKTQTRIRGRLDRLEKGNFGDCESVGSGVFELRLHFGLGYRIYFGEVGRTIVLLLCGGDKSTQARDIQHAKTYWLEHEDFRGEKENVDAVLGTSEGIKPNIVFARDNK